MLFLKSGLALIGMFYGINMLYATSLIEKEHEISQKAGVILSIQEFSQEIKRSQKEVNIDNIKLSYKKFNNFNYTDGQWKDIADHFRVYKWPSQGNWKQAVGGHLFYPENLDSTMDFHYREHFLTRGDTIWSLIMASKFENPVARYYLAYILDKVHTSFAAVSKKPLVIEKLYAKAFESLSEDAEKENGNPETFYILGRNHIDDSYKVGSYRFDVEEAFKLFGKSSDSRNRFYRLFVRDNYNLKTDDGEPSIEEFDQLAEKYPAAYLYLANRSEEFNIKKEYYEKAVKSSHVNAFYELSNLYLEQNDQENAKKTFEALGIDGKVELAKLTLGKIGNLSFEQDIQHLSPSILQTVTKLLEDAAANRNMEAWEYLTILNYQSRKKDEMIKCLENGIKLGSINAYHMAHKILSADSFKKITKKYGYAYDHEEFLKNLGKFLNVNS